MLITVGFFIPEIAGGVLRQFDVPAIPAVADYGLLNYPPIRKITRSRNPETCTAPAIVRYSMLCIGYLLIHHFCFSFFIAFSSRSKEK
jgi:hypothetical protein